MTERHQYLAIDFSARSTPALGPDSLWLAHGSVTGQIRTYNVATRHQLSDLVQRLCSRASSTLIVLDVALGWPSGAATLWGEVSWRDVQRRIARDIRDDERNRNNRFAVASQLNETAGQSLFWGCPPAQRTPFLSSTTAPLAAIGPREIASERLIERHVGRGIKSPFQLLGAGAVGSQSLMAQAWIERWREHLDLSVWPFEEPRPVTVAESFFSLLPWAKERGSCRDEQQVRAALRWLRANDEDSRLTSPSLFDALSDEEREAVRTQEGWLLGFSSTGGSLIQAG